jgi:predicted dehydrogenase
MSAVERITAAVVGLGYWGPNLARNLAALPGVELRWLCDADLERLGRWAQLYPTAKTADRLEELLADPDLDLVCLATPVASHASLCRSVLEAGKHCFVEKPLARSSAEARQLAELAERKGLTLMVGHLLLYHPAVVKLKELIGEGALGDLYYLYTNRLNLGQLRRDENALWSLGAHDVSVLLYLLEEQPQRCIAHGEAFLQEGIEDVVFCYLRFPSGVAAHLHLSWLDPHKERRLTAVGSKRMATFDDMALEGKLTIFDKGFDQDFRSWGEYLARSGERLSPALPAAEPLRLECEHLLRCLREGSRPRSDGRSAVAVVQVLEELERSLREGR